MFKFRSMKKDAPVIPPYEMTDEQRNKYETKFGRFLRKTSLDETLQFINVFIGQMSIVGPRPGAKEHEDMLIKARESYTPNAYDVRPGISGYAQIKMKREHDPEFKAEWDSKYVERMGFFFDAGVFGYTILKIAGTARGR